MILSKQIQKISILIILIIFFIINFKNIDYGLPFFVNTDEIAFLTSSLSFISFITDIPFKIIDPIVAPFMNILIILNLIFFNELLVNLHSTIQIKEKIYLNPELFIYYGRVSSLIVSTLALSLLYLIFKKLKINFYIYLPILISLIFSLFLADISIVNGKNSYYLFFFLLQLYYLIKYLDNIKKFKFTSYFILALLASLSWGINYWSSVISIYGVLIIHYQKFKYNNLKYLIFFLIIFLILGFFPNYFLSTEFENSSGPFAHIFGDSSDQYNSFNSFISLFFDKLLFSFRIINYTEQIFLIFVFLSFFYLFKKSINKKMFLILSLILLEPIILFSLASDVVIQIRYFSGIICLFYILLALILNDLLSYKFSQKIVILFFAVNVFFAFQKITINNQLFQYIKNKHSFYDFYYSNKDLNQSTLYISNQFFIRNNIANLLFYKNLYENDLIKKTKYGKFSLENIISKIDKIKITDENLIINKKLKENLHIFDTNSFEINDFKIFFDEVKKQYQYIVIDKTSYDPLIKKYIEVNYKMKKLYKIDGTDTIYFESLRSMIHFISEGNQLNKNIVYGNNYELYELF